MTYEELHRHCYTCKRISHEEGTCPSLTEEQREQKQLERLEQKKQEELAQREAFSAPQSHLYTKQHSSIDSRKVDMKKQEHEVEKTRERVQQDLRRAIQEKRDTRGKTVWNRIERSPEKNYP